MLFKNAMNDLDMRRALLEKCLFQMNNQTSIDNTCMSAKLCAQCHVLDIPKYVCSGMMGAPGVATAVCDGLSRTIVPIHCAMSGTVSAALAPTKRKAGGSLLLASHHAAGGRRPGQGCTENDERGGVLRSQRCDDS